MKPTVEAAFWELPHPVRQLAWRALRPRSFREAREQRKWPADRGGSLEPFDRHRCLFVHVPKAAGTSVVHGLFGQSVGYHRTLRHYSLIFNARELREYFKFTFVRNPWDRLYSAFSYLKAGGGNPWDRRWAETHLAGIDDFETFVTQWLPQVDLESSYVHFIPQYRFLQLRGAAPAVDFIGHFESLEPDFEIIRSRLGIDATLVHMRPSRRSHDYRTVYTDTMKAIVARAYGKDIDLLGYEFEGLLGPAVLERLHGTESSP